MEKEKIIILDNHHAPEKKNGATAMDGMAANDETITIVVNFEHYKIEIEIF